MQENNYGYRRKAKRTMCLLDGSYKTIDGSDNKIKCRDISRKGAGVMTQDPLTVNSQLKIEIQTKKAETLTLEGKICWNKKALGGWISGVVFNKTLPFEIDKVV